MTIKSYGKANAAMIAHIEDMLAQDPLAILFTPAKLPDEPTVFEDEDPPEPEPILTLPEGIIAIHHIISECHLDRLLLQFEKAREILAAQCIHYARVCGVTVFGFCFADGFFELTIGIRADSLCHSKMIGCIKQQFTNHFKTWFNGTYRREDRYRKHRLGDGTLWKGRSRYERIEDDAQFAACMLDMENIRLVTECKSQIGALEEAPRFLVDLSPDDGLGPQNPFLMQEPYRDLLDVLTGYTYQSARWYLTGECCPKLCLTDGTDGIWATADECKFYEKTLVRDLPKGWRKVWFKGRFGFLKPTPQSARRFAQNTFFERLGDEPKARAANFGRLLLTCCFQNRQAIAAETAEAQSSEPGF